MKRFNARFVFGVLLVGMSVSYFRPDAHIFGAEEGREFTIHAWKAELPTDNLAFLASVRHHDVWLAAYEDFEGIIWVFYSFRNDDVSSGGTGLGMGYDPTGLENRTVNEQRLNRMLVEMKEHFERADRFGRSRTRVMDVILPEHDFSDGLELTLGWSPAEVDRVHARAKMFVYPLHEKSR